MRRPAREDNVRGTQAPHCGHSAAEEMAAFDRLPRRVRERIAAAKFDFCAVDAAFCIGLSGAGAYLMQLAIVQRRIEEAA